MKNIKFIAFALAVICITTAYGQKKDGKTPTTIKTVGPTIKDKPLLVTTKKMTSFTIPAKGYNFSNTFTVELPIPGLNGPTMSGLCGGMVYSALDYYNNGMAIPTQGFRPAVKTPLHDYIYRRQVTSLADNADKWTELFVNPFGWRSDEFFNWGLQASGGGRIEELKSMIDQGKPVPLGLFALGNGGAAPHHQVLAVGYDMGRYKGDLGDFKEDFKIFVYDPNEPTRLMTIIPNVQGKYFTYKEYPNEDRWQTYFVDKKYKSNRPPSVVTPAFPNDGKVHELLVEICTGNDDLRGGNDNVHLTVNFSDGTSETFLNINGQARWIDNYVETVPLRLKNPKPLSQIVSVTFKTTFGGGIGGDNWNVNEIRVIACGYGINQNVINKSGRPLVRFDGNNKPLTINLTR